MSEYGDLLRIPEPRKVEKGIDEDSLYAVFVSYVEIYNNYVYDLLEEQQANSIKAKYVCDIYFSTCIYMYVYYSFVCLLAVPYCFIPA